MFRTTLRVAACALAIGVAAAPALSQDETTTTGDDGHESGGAVDFSRYASSSANLSAIASAAALVEPCSVPLTYSEEVIESYDTVELTVLCAGGEDDEAAVILRFLMLGEDVLIPQSFEFAG